MSPAKVVWACTAAILFGTSAASAVSVTNRDDMDHKITVVEGDARQDHVLKPSAALDGVCMKGCIIRLDDSEANEYELEGSEIVSIEEGYLYYDGPDVSAEPDTDGSGKPSEPKPKPK